MEEFRKVHNVPVHSKIFLVLLNQPLTFLSLGKMQVSVGGGELGQGPSLQVIAKLKVMQTKGLVWANTHVCLYKRDRDRTRDRDTYREEKKRQPQKERMKQRDRVRHKYRDLDT
jgi:hypothetical protein